MMTRALRGLLCALAFAGTLGQFDAGAEQRGRSRSARRAAATQRRAPAVRPAPSRRAARAAVQSRANAAARRSTRAAAASTGTARSARRGARPGITVLGHYQQTSGRGRGAAGDREYEGYWVRVGKKIGANYFYVKPEIWDRMSPRQQRRMNERFLDGAISRGDRIRLSTRVHLARPGRGYAHEIRYLRARGYRISPNGRWMLPPPQMWRAQARITSPRYR